MEKTMNLDYSFVEWLSKELELFVTQAKAYADLDIPVAVGGQTTPLRKAITRLQQLIEAFQTMRDTGKGNIGAMTQAIAMSWAELIPHMWL